MSDTSPICNLAIVGRLNLLRLQFAEILIPLAVRDELERLSHPEALRDLRAALNKGWIKVQAIRDPRIARLLQATLHRGEGEAIALAIEAQAGLILLDERDARVAAERTGVLAAALYYFCRFPMQLASVQRDVWHQAGLALPYMDRWRQAILGSVG